MKPLLNLNQLTKHFGGLQAVNSVSLTIDEGEILGLIGPNGAGKTTVFNMISGTFAPSSGNVTFAGEDITGLPPHKVCHRGIARTFQLVKPFAKLSVIDNVMVGAFMKASGRQAAATRAREVVEFVGLGTHADRPAHTLTTAGRKRLELARALATQPHLLLLDEVMAGLTPTESLGMVSLIQRIREAGISMLVIEHVMKAIMSLSDRIAVLHHGELIAVGAPQDIATNREVIEAYLGEEYQFAQT